MKKDAKTLFIGGRAYGKCLSFGGNTGRKPSPRKLEIHEVIAKLKARKADGADSATRPVREPN